MCPPTFFAVQEVKNPYMSGLPSIDTAKAQQEWENLCRAFREVGVEVNCIDPVAGLEDMAFAANQVFVGSHERLGNFIVASRMRYESRRAEVAHYITWFRQHDYAVLEVALDGEFLEGHGDLLWHPDRSRIWAGYGFRSSRGGVAEFQSAMRSLHFEVMPLELVDPHFYHLDTCFSVLNAESVLIYPEAFTAGGVRAIEQGWRRVYKTTKEDAMRFSCNGVSVNGRYLVSHLTPSLEAALKQEGINPLIVDMSEFEKSGGSVFCLKNFLPS